MTKCGHLQGLSQHRRGLTLAQRTAGEPLGILGKRKKQGVNRALSPAHYSQWNRGWISEMPPLLCHSCSHKAEAGSLSLSWSLCNVLAASSCILFSFHFLLIWLRTSLSHHSKCGQRQCYPTHFLCHLSKSPAPRWFQSGPFPCTCSTWRHIVPLFTCYLSAAGAAFISRSWTLAISRMPLF